MAPPLGGRHLDPLLNSWRGSAGVTPPTAAALARP